MFGSSTRGYFFSARIFVSGGNDNPLTMESAEEQKRLRDIRRGIIPDPDKQLKMDQEKGSSICFCACHYTGMLHIVACCHPCEHCGRRVILGERHLHSKHCQDKPTISS